MKYRNRRWKHQLPANGLVYATEGGIFRSSARRNASISVKLDGCRSSMALRLILEEVVRPLDSDAVTIMSFSVILSGCKAIAIVVSRWMDRD